MKYVTLDITSKCNLKCKHCYNREKYNSKNQEELSIKLIYDIIDKLSDLGCQFINFLGGEPLLFKDIYNVIDYCHNRNIMVSMTTNGTLLDLETYKKLLHSGINNIDVSLDGSLKYNNYMRGNNTYEIVVKNLEDIFSSYKNNNIRISYTLTQYNYIDLLNFILEMNIIGIKDFLIGFYMETSENINFDFYIEKKNIILKHLEDVLLKLSELNLDINIELNFRPIYVYYLRTTYKSIVSNNKLFSKCAYKEGLCYIEANGEVHPCNVYSINNINEFNHNEYNRINTKFLNESFEKNWKLKTRLFDKVFDESREVSDICNYCIFKDICVPCPFQFKDKNDILECYYAFEKMKNFLNVSSYKYKSIFKDYFKKIKVVSI